MIMIEREMGVRGSKLGGELAYYVVYKHISGKEQRVDGYLRMSICQGVGRELA